MPLIPKDVIEVRRSRGRGRGVFAREFIKRGTVIERVPLIVFPEKHLEIDEGVSALYPYVFEWSRGRVALALGFGSIYNHSFKPNARYDDQPPQTKIFTAIKDIQPGDEITVNYNGHQDDCSPMDFTVV